MAINRRELLFKAQGGLGKLLQPFGAELPQVIEILNWEIAA